MQDGYGRNIDYLRVSVTDRCNLRCRYCMPEDGVPGVSHTAVLRYEEILRIVRIFASLGFKKIKLTGGEPLVRRNLPDLVAGLRAIPGITQVTLTTNGILLPEQLPDLVSAGLTAVNISLDTLQEDTFRSITRRKGADRVRAGLDAALAMPGLRVKVNCVPTMQNRAELPDIAALARDSSLAVRFIEMMPIGLGASFAPVSEDDTRKMLEERFGPLIPTGEVLGNGPARYFRAEGFTGRIGFISAVSHQFCDSCNRVRLTSTGYLKTCLQYDIGADLRSLLAGDEETLKAAIVAAIGQKPREHHFSQQRPARAENLPMSAIGG